MYSRGSVGQEGFVVTVGYVEDAAPRKNKYLRSEGESIKKFLARWTCRRFLTSIFRLPLVDDVSEGIRLSDVVGGWSEVVGRRWRSMRWEIKIFREQIKTSPQKQACHQHLTLFFHPPPAVGIYERPWGSDQVEVGRGSSGRRCHDGGEGQHEVSPCLVLIKSLVSISKIH